jgi:hypothetical protein
MDQQDERASGQAQGPATGAVGANDAVIEELFTYHPPDDLQKVAYKTIREGAKNFAKIIDGCCPPGPDRTAAIRKIREAVFVANACIATGNAQYR